MTETQKTGQKFDEGKTRFDLVPPESLTQIAEVFTHGAKKYGDYNWTYGLHSSRFYAAAQRHLHSYWGGDVLDKESGLSHLAHACANLIMMMSSRDHQWGVMSHPKDVSPLDEFKVSI